jgi:Protein of unknown function (DUF2867)
LIDRLPDDLRGTATDLDLGSQPFVPLYRTEDEYAAELSNRTVHAVMHLAWDDRGEGRYRGQMAVLVKPRGPFGKGIHGLHQAVPVRGGVSRAHAPHRTRVNAPDAAVATD